MQAAGETTALGLWRYAGTYLKAARTLDDADPNPWFASHVSYQCACQGIELAFKSYLRAKGFSLKKLRKVGHSLGSCMEAAKAQGMRPPSAQAAAAIAMIDRYYKEHQFRYIVTGMKQYPSLGDLLKAGAAILNVAASDVASAMNPDDAGLAKATTRRMKLDVSATFGATRPPRTKARRRVSTA